MEGDIPRWWQALALLSSGAAIGIAIAYWQSSRGRFLAMAAAAPGPRLITDELGRLLVANDAFRSLMGLARAELLPLTDSVFDDVQAVAAILVDASMGQVATSDLRLKTPGGVLAAAATVFALPGRRRLVWDFAVKPVPAQPLPPLGGQTDEDVLASLPASLTGLFDQVPVGVFIAKDGDVLYANQTFSQWVGLEARQINQSGMRLSDVLIIGSDGATARLLSRKGGSRHVRLLQASTDDDGRILGVLLDQSLIASGIAGGRMDAEKLAGIGGAESQFRRYFDFAPIGILVLDARGIVTEANGAAAQMIAAGGTDTTKPATNGLIGRRLAEFVRPEDEQAVANSLAAARRGETVAPLDLHLADSSASPDAARPDQSKSESGKVVQLFFAGLEGGGETGAQLAYLVDLSEQKRLESQFAQSQKMQAVGQLAGGIAHDFNNLLTAMIGFCDLLLMRHQPGEQTFADVMQIKQNASRAANLVRQLLAFSRRQTLRPKVIDITDVLADLRNLLARLIGETIDLKLIHGRDLWPVKVDQSQLEQVIINLVVNARDAINAQGTLTEGGRLAVRTANEAVNERRAAGADVMPPGDYVLIEVSDTGHGIAPENMTKIFEPFFTTKAVGAGTGLGLSTVYGIIKQTGGFIAVESSIGKGAQFRVYLPRHHPGQDEVDVHVPLRAEGARDLTGKGRVLLVEDEDAVRTFAARALRNKGYTVLEANSGEKALEVAGAEAATIDVLVSDIVMPGMDGPSLAVHLRDLRPDLRIIFISGYAEDAVRKNMDRIPGVSFLAKPFSLAELATKVKEVLEAGS